MTDENSKQTPDESTGENGTPPEKETIEAAGAEDVPDEAKEKARGWWTGKLDGLKEENAELKDRLLRAAAEMENLRRRTERDKSDTAKFAVSNFARDTLTIADNLSRAIAHVPDGAADKDPALKSFLEGVQVTERELMNVMERHGIARLDPQGERFDPNKHQAMFEVDNKDVPEGTIIEVVQPGYVIAERILRPAMVGVAKGGAKVKKPQAPAPEAAPEAANDDVEAKTTTADAKPDAKAGEPAEPKKGAKAPPKNFGGKLDKNA
jgi:molecular chaperone GrpE